VVLHSKIPFRPSATTDLMRAQAYNDGELSAGQHDSKQWLTLKRPFFIKVLTDL
jgi:hypothetical protein